MRCRGAKEKWYSKFMRGVKYIARGPGVQVAAPPPRGNLKALPIVHRLKYSDNVPAASKRHAEQSSLRRYGYSKLKRFSTKLNWN